MTTQKLGIIGGGQLACLLFQAAQKLNIPTILFVESSSSPAIAFGYPTIVGQVSDENFKKFIASVDVVTFENEWISIHELQKHAHQKEFYPGLKTLETLQDKISQKNILKQLNIPTAPFEIIESPEHIASSLKKAESVFGAYILKWSRYGYDGKGVCFSHEEPSTLTKFCEEAFRKNAQVYIESKVQFKNELALVCARGKSGDFFAYPLVRTQQKSGVCEWVFSDESISNNLHQEAQAYARTMAEHLNYVGILAIEFFLTQDNKLMVNEMAPRVHNSGHYSLSASTVSQFENHVRAVMGLDILFAQNEPYFAMLNLLGPAGVTLKLGDDYILPNWNETDFDLYWYRKNEIKPSRKMGHINISAKNQHDFNLKLTDLKERHQQWIRDIQNEKK